MRRHFVPSLLSFCLIGVLSPLTVPAVTFAEPVFGEVFSLYQPDGARVRLRIWGDEFYQVVESLDGYTVLRDPFTQFICYARLGNSGTELISTGVAIGHGFPADLGLTPHIRIGHDSAEVKARTARAHFAYYQDDNSASSVKSMRRTTTLGEVEGICLLIDFADEMGTIDPSEVDKFCNEIGYTGFGNNGSVRDYFDDVSDGRLTYTNYVTPSYYRAVHNKTYYIDPHVPHGIRARELVLEALSALDDSGFDFSQYDSNGDGYIDAVNCLYAGPRRSDWGSGLWPHSWEVDFAADGVITDKYAIIDMANDDTGDELRLSTFCHENGHMLGDWPDLYDYEFDSAGVGNYCIMGGNLNYTSYTNPQEPCAYLKDLAGWSTTILLTEPLTDLVISAGTNVFYKYEHPTSPNEYYILENRHASGRDSGLPDSGLAVWHIDTLGSNDNQEMTPTSHYEVTLVQADGNWDLEHYRNRGDATDLWASPLYPICGPHTNPNTSWWDGTRSELHIRDISVAGPTMTFSFTVGADCNGNFVPDDQDIANGTSEDCQPDGIPDECQLSDNDCNENGVPDTCELSGHDCNENGVLDACDIAAGTSADCNHNGRPDECDVASGSSADCNENGSPDECDVGGGTSLDCQPDGVPDECQLSGNDCDGSNVPDVCELPGRDCNANGTLDVCDIASGTSADCNLNGKPDECDVASGSSEDCNGNGSPDECDVGGGLSLDCQPDGIPDECQLADNDCDGSNVPDTCELPGRDCNDNGTLDACDIASGTSADCNFNAKPDECDVASGTSEDCNGNGSPDECDIEGGTSPDCQPDEIPDECQLAGNDCDGSNVPDTCELPGHDCNENGTLDVCDIANGTSTDCNLNARPDECDIASGSSEDCNGNGSPDECDIEGGTSPDCQPDGIPDECQLAGNDCDGSNIPDVCELPGRDCNGNSVLDVCDIADGTSTDCNRNEKPDECDVSSGSSADCNGNSFPDECDIEGGTSPDCQPDGIPDECQLAGNDCDGSGVPDVCELPGHDCNGNGVLDVCDIADGTSADCNLNARPDECDLTSGSSEDCNGNGSPDECDVAGGMSFDCQPDGIPDECQLSGNDCNGSNIPDVCELPDHDCNGNGVLDVCDIARGTSNDGNGNNIPDECEREPCPMPEAVKFTAFDGAVRDFFGYAVSIFGDTAIVGAWADDAMDRDSGSAYVFKRTGSTWTYQSKLVPSDGTANADFGGAVSLFGDTAVVGAFQDSDNNISGSAYVFRFNGSSWVQRQKLLPPLGEPYALFGSAVSVHGDKMLVGAYEKDILGATDTGAAYAFRWNGSQWGERQQLLAADRSTFDYFGYAVAVSGDAAVVGAPGVSDPGDLAGAAYIFKFDGSGWVEEQKLRSNDVAEKDRFGHAVAISDTTVVIGARHDDDMGDNSGSAYVFRFDGVEWTQVQKLLAWDGEPGDEFGYSVAVSSGIAVVGAWNADGWGSNSGAAYVFDVSGSVPFPRAKLMASDGSSSDVFAYAVSISDTGTVIAGAYKDNGMANQSGSAYAFHGVTADCNANRAIDYCDIFDGVSEDGDGNGIPDECEVAGPGDFDADGDVDLVDYRAFVECAAGPSASPNPGQSASAECLNAFDFDEDADNDLADFSVLQRFIR